jgi:hypothetical protein
MKQKLLLGLVLVSTMFFTGCWITAEQGTVQYETIWDVPGEIIRPESGGKWTIFIMGSEYHPVSVKSITTEPITVQAQSKDNARLNLQVAVTYHLKNDDASIREHIAQFGVEETTRDKSFNKVLVGHINTEVRNAVAPYDAYTLMANQGTIQNAIFTKLKVILETQLRQEIESVQLMTAPDFENNDIELAASKVVANQKLKEAADAAQSAAIVETETKKIQAQNFENPKIYALEMQKLRVEEAKAWSAHQGTLIFGQGNNSPILQLPSK